MAINDDFWLEEPKHPLDAYGQPAYGPSDPRHPSWKKMTRWEDLGRNGEYLRSEWTKWVYMHPATNWKLWHLAGPGRGREGVVLAKGLEGVMQPEFENLYSEGPYLIGAVRERTDYKKRTISMGVHIQPNGNAEREETANPWSYRRIEDAWWNSWSPKVPGYLGTFTRTHGWRWLSVTLGEATKTAIDIDPIANGNYSKMWNMVLHAPQPFYAKRALTRAWEADPLSVNTHGVATGNIAIANRGTWEAWPKYIVRGTGEATVQDGIGGRQITLPKLYPTDGAYMLVDTDPAARTITTEKDPVDNQLYKFLRNSELLDIILNDTTAQTLPAQRRIPGGIGFDGAIPPRTIANLKVTHTNPNGSITCIMPQRYEMGWS